ncbi:hypothetical protein HDZ31DRAFT_66279 [Schizophyllum fasciatum]
MSFSPASPPSILLTVSNDRHSAHPYSSSLSSSSASTSSSVSDRAEPLSSETSLSGTEAGPLPKRPMLYTPRGRVRFAPLPDPRRSVLVTDTGDELPLPFDDPDMNRVPAAASVSCPLVSKAESAPTPMFGNKENEKDDPAQYASAPLAYNGAPPLTAPRKKKSRPLSKALLRPFSTSSSGDADIRRCSSQSPSETSLTPTPSLASNNSTATHVSSATLKSFPSPEEILTLGTINLFRTSSRSSDSGSSLRSGWGRRTSKASLYNGGSPLTRSESTQSYASPAKAGPSSASAPSSPLLGKKKKKSRSSSVSAPERRMLNGRVYGRRPVSAVNHFRTIRDTDPEFVEWGYGGMGSVKNEDNRWSKVQGATSFGSRDPDEDDGSGMGWVRRRKEQREREAKEKEEREKKAASPEPEPVAEEVPRTPSPKPTVPTRPSQDTPRASTTSPPTAQHETKLVSVPIPQRGHLKMPSRSNSLGLTGVDEPPQEAREQAEELSRHLREMSQTSSTSSEEESDSESSGDAEREEDDEEDEEEDKKTEEARRSARAAGVELVSRHHH